MYENLLVALGPVSEPENATLTEMLVAAKAKVEEGRRDRRV